MKRTQFSSGPVVMFLLAASILSTHVSAGGDANAAKGIVVEHCVACHEVPGYASKAGVAKLDAPSFVTIANDTKAFDPIALKIGLRQPHWPMQQFVLSERDVDNLLAFIESLRSE
jgi:mono/diheme cytochrome c family protein